MRGEPFNRRRFWETVFGPRRDVPPYYHEGTPKWDTLRNVSFSRPSTRLDYRPEHPRHLTLSFWFLLAASTFSVFLVCLVQQLGSEATQPLLGPIWIIALVVVPVYFLTRESTMRRALFALIAIGVGYLLLRAVRLSVLGWTPVSAGLLVTALVSLVNFLDSIATHALEWELADPLVPEPARRAMLELWRERFSWRRARATDPSSPGAPLVGALRDYPLRLVAVVPLAVLALMEHAYLAPILALPLFVLLSLRKRGGPSGVIASAMAMQLFLFYGEVGEGAPGVLQTSAGGVMRRRLLTVSTVFLLAAALASPVGLPYLRYLYYRYPVSAYPFLVTIFSSLLLPLALITDAILLSISGVLRRASLAASITKESWQECDSFATDAEGRTRRSAASRYRTAWDVYTERVFASSDPEERRHLFFGVHARTDKPIYLPLRTLEGHSHILGASGSGKTALAVGPLVAQLIRRGEHDPADRSPVVVIDMKGDNALFHGVRLEAERAGRRFKFFTNIVGNDTFIFDPVSELRARTLTVSQVCQVLLNGLNLEHGWGYGPGYFSALGRAWLTRVLQLPGAVDSFSKLAALASDRSVTSREEEKNALEVISTIRTLAALPSLSLDPERPHDGEAVRNAIRMPSALEEDHVVYFWLDTSVEEATARQIAGLAVYALYTACKERADRGQRKRTYLLLDEFQSVAGRNFSQVVQKARSAGLSLILCNQEREALRLDSRTDLFKVLEESTALRLFFSARSPEMRKYLEELSGETIYLGRSWTSKRETWSSGSGRHSGWKHTEGSTEQEQIGPRFRPNDIIELSAEEDVAFAHFPSPEGLAPEAGYLTVVRCPYHITVEEHRRREALPWPEDLPGTIKCRLESPSTSQEEPQATRTRARCVPPVVRDSSLAERYENLVFRKD